jgi:hypothetical protein
MPYPFLLQAVYFNLCLSVVLGNLSCSFTSISFLTTSCSFTLICAFGKSSGYPLGKSSGYPFDKSSGYPFGKSSGYPFGKSSDYIFGKSSGYDISLL